MNEQTFDPRTGGDSFAYISESNGREPMITVADDGYPVTVLRDTFRQQDRAYESRRVQFEEAIESYRERPSFQRELRVREALTTSDMPLLFTDSMQRTLVAEYEEQASIEWRQYADVARFNDSIGAKPFYALTAGDGALDRVNELGEYKERRLYETEWSYRIAKYGNRFQFSFEFFLKRDIDIFNRSLRALAQGAVRREARVVTSLFVDANGPHASLYNVGNGNIIPGNPPLTFAGFDAAIAALRSRVHPDTGEPITISMAVLVVPPQLETQARLLLNTVDWETTIEGRVIKQANPYRGMVTLVVNPYIPVVATTANGATSWFLFASPRNGRPAIQVGFLGGYEQPQLFIKEPNQRRITVGGSGGGSNLFDGSFENDSIENKIRMFIGGGRLDGRMTMASNGSGA